MKMAISAAGTVCAVLAFASSGQQGTTSDGGPLNQFEVNLDGLREYVVSAGGTPVNIESDFSRRTTVTVPQMWSDRSFDGLDAGQNDANSQFEAFIESDADRLSGGIDISAQAFSAFDDSGSSTRLFHDLNIAVTDLDLVADVFITFNASTGLNGFGLSTLTYFFGSDEFGERGVIRTDESEGFSMLFEDVRVSHLDIAFTARTQAATDSPVINSTADLNVNWSVEIMPVPAPASAAGLAAFGLLAAQRRR